MDNDRKKELCSLTLAALQVTGKPVSNYLVQKTGPLINSRSSTNKLLSEYIVSLQHVLFTAQNSKLNINAFFRMLHI